MSILPLEVKEEPSAAHLPQEPDDRTAHARVSFPPPANRAGVGLETIVTAKEGETVSSLLGRHYGWVNLTMLDLVLDSNPEITNVNLIYINQAIRFPRITEESLIVTSPDFRYKIHAGTFRTQDASKPYINEPILTGKEIEVIPRQVSPQETWYRVIIGKFKDKEEALRTIRALKQKRLLPLF